MHSFDTDDQTLYVWTDGACSKNGSVDSYAGIGVWFGENDQRNVSEPIYGYSTSYRAELEAVIRAMTITLHDKHVHIYCDNYTVVDCFTKYPFDKLALQSWELNIPELVAWQKIWLIQLTRTFLGLDRVEIEHVRGHSDNYGNKEADKLAVNGRMSKVKSHSM